MAIILPSGFNVTNQQPIDSRLVLTKAEMLTAVDARMPQNYICICKDDGKEYIYNASNSVDPVIGKFRLIEDTLDLPRAISKTTETVVGRQALEEAISVTLPGAIEKSISTEPDKFADAMIDVFNSEHFEKTIDNKIDLSISLIQAVTSNE